MVLLSKPSAVELFTQMGVVGYGWPSSVRVVRMGIASCPLMKLAPISAYAVDDMTLLIIFDTVCMGPLRGVLV